MRVMARVIAYNSVENDETAVQGREVNAMIELKVVVSETYSDRLREAMEADADSCCGDATALAAYPVVVLGICSYADYIMGRVEKPTAIPNEDRDYLRDVYYNHTLHPASSGQ